MTTFATPPFIHNCSLADITRATHSDPGVNNLLIQIVNPDMTMPVPKYPFAQVEQFWFADVEDDSTCYGPGISDQQAEQLVQLLQQAFEKRTNVIVHCVAGLCRSGAVTEVAVQMGFRDPNVARVPNLRVKHKMQRVLGWTYD